MCVCVCICVCVCVCVRVCVCVCVCVHVSRALVLSGRPGLGNRGSTAPPDIGHMPG